RVFGQMGCKINSAMWKIGGLSISGQVFAIISYVLCSWLSQQIGGYIFSFYSYGSSLQYAY
ncbi:hypothetical protein ACJX0J_027606, partial [Zea mays]